MSVNLKISTVGQGQTLVFLHGWGVNSGVWQPLVNLLKNDYCIVTIDLPGFGKNHDKLPSPYNIQTVSHAIAEHIPEDCVLVGWSLGGLIAQQIAYDFPHLLKQLILICSSPQFSKSDDWPGIESNVLALFTQQLTQNFSKTLERFLAIQAMGSDSARLDVKAIKQNIQQYPEPSEMALKEGLNMLKSVDLREQLKSLHLPCYLFLGRLDSLVPHSVSELIQNLSPQLNIEIIAKASHAPFISDTPDFAKRLKAILLSL